jgi:protein-tyrosine phosphatase
VIDLRVPAERELKPNAICVHQTADVRSAPLPIPYSVSRADYVADLNTTESISEAFRALGDGAAYPIYFHCTWGRDRTGVLAALILLALGATHAEIMQEYLLSRPIVGAYPDSLAAVLEEVERRGGVDAYLAAAGIPAETIATLRARATAP